MINQDKIIGILFLLVFPLYGIGSDVILQLDDSSTNSSFIGLMMLFANSFAVLIIGRYLQRIAIIHDVKSANIYFIVRFSEALLLAIYSLIIYDSKIHSASNSTETAVTAAATYKYLYNFAMLGLGIGSFPILITFKRVKMIPSWLASFGLLGYCFVAVGVLADLFKIVKEENIIVMLMIPGALFELTFASWLIAFGFPENEYEAI